MSPLLCNTHKLKPQASQWHWLSKNAAYISPPAVSALPVQPHLCTVPASQSSLCGHPSSLWPKCSVDSNSVLHVGFYLLCRHVLTTLVRGSVLLSLFGAHSFALLAHNQPTFPHTILLSHEFGKMLFQGTCTLVDWHYCLFICLNPYPYCKNTASLGHCCISKFYKNIDHVANTLNCYFCHRWTGEIKPKLSVH